MRCPSNQLPKLIHSIKRTVRSGSQPPRPCLQLRCFSLACVQLFRHQVGNIDVVVNSAFYLPIFNISTTKLVTLTSLTARSIRESTAEFKGFVSQSWSCHTNTSMPIMVCRGLTGSWGRHWAAGASNHGILYLFTAGIRHRAVRRRQRRPCVSLRSLGQALRRSGALRVDTGERRSAAAVVAQ